MAKGFEKMTVNRSLQVVSQVWRQGIGISKREMMAKFGGVSPLVHSFSTYNRYTGIVKELVNYVREEFGINRIDKLKPEHFDNFLHEKIAKGYSEKTLKINMCALEKYTLTIKRDDLFKHIHVNFHNFYIKAREKLPTMGFTNPERVIQKLEQKNPVYSDIAKIQYHTGARIGDVKKVKVDIENTQVVIEGSKGGRGRVIDYSDRVEKFNIVKDSVERLNEELKNTDWKDLRQEYTKAVRDVANSLTESYYGTHAFRVNYASERYEELKEIGGYSLADRVLTQELGHNRVEMSRYYAGK